MTLTVEEEKRAPTGMSPQPGRRRTLAPGLFLLWAMLGAALVGFPSASASHLPLTGATHFFPSACSQVLDAVTDHTMDASDEVGGGDVTLGNDALNTGSQFFYFGAKDNFTKVIANITRAGAGGEMKWQYWASTNQWVDLTVSRSPDDDFTQLVPYTVSFAPPSNWAKKEIDVNWCKDQFFYVRVQTTTAYNTIPQADMVHAVQFDLRVKVLDELDHPLGGLAASNFVVSAGSDNVIRAFRALAAPGVYELALLGRNGADMSYDVRASAQGYVQGNAVGTGTLSDKVEDYTDGPMRLPFSIKVIVRSDAGAAVSGATIHVASDPPAYAVGEAYYFSRADAGRLNVTKADYQDLDFNADKQINSIGVSTAAQTVVTLSGSLACGNSTSVPGGGAATCRGLRPKATGGTSGTGTGGGRGSSSTNTFWSQPGGSSGSYVLSNGSSVWVPAEEAFDPRNPNSNPVAPPLGPWGWAAIAAFLVFLFVLLLLRPRKGRGGGQERREPADADPDADSKAGTQEENRPGPPD